MYLAWKEYFDSHEIENVLKNSFRKEKTALETKGKIKEKKVCFLRKAKLCECRSMFLCLDI